MDASSNEQQKESTEPVSYSPRRLAVGYYCGTLAKHSRTDGGQPESPGLIYGNQIDKVIAMFYMSGAYPSPGSNGIDELEYVVVNTPPTVPGIPILSTDVRGQFHINGIDFIVGGKTDLTFDSLVVEIKTGVDKEWHLIQALCYATILDRPCRILYATRKHHKTVEPDRRKLEDIIWQSYVNEQNASAAKCEHCSTCPVKLGCPVWNEYNSLARVLLGLQEAKKDEQISAADRKELEKTYGDVRALALKYLEEGQTYKADLGTVSVTNGKLYVRSKFELKD